MANTTKTHLALAIALALGTAACSEAPAPSEQPQQQAATQQVNEATQQSESEKANKLFEDIFMEAVMRSPMYQSYLGIKQDQDKWDDISDAKAEEELAIAKANLEKVEAIDENKLNEQTYLSWQLMKQELEQEIADHKWRHYNYPVNQMFGLHSSVVSLLINQHRISDTADAEAYISRLNGLPELFAQLQENLKIRAEKGIIAPKFVYPYVISDSQNIIKGAPFEDGEPSVLLEDFTKKIDNLDIEQAQYDQLVSAAEQALTQSVKPAYENLISTVEELEQQADTKDGAWKFPEGEAFFNNRLQRTTTTDLTANE